MPVLTCESLSIFCSKMDVRAFRCSSSVIDHATAVSLYVKSQPRRDEPVRCPRDRLTRIRGALRFLYSPENTGALWEAIGTAMSAMKR
jgi:hypothetical protein